MKEVKQNKNSSVVFRRLYAFLCAFVVLLFSVSISAFAYTDTSTNGVDFTDQPIEVTSSGFGVNGYHIGTTSIGNGLLYCSFSRTVGDVYYYTYTDANSRVHLVAVSETSFASSNYWRFFPGKNDYQGQVGTYVNDTSSSPTLYYKDYQTPVQGAAWGDYSLISLPDFSSLGDGLSAFRDWLNNPPPVLVNHPLNVTLPAGNAIIINVTGNNYEALSLSSTSALRHKDNWSDGNQMMGYFASAPSSLSSPFDGTHSITWRGVGSPNLFGGYNTWSSTAPLNPNGNYLVIINPAYPNDNPDSITSNQASNGAINISCGFCLASQIVPLSSSWYDGSIVSSSGNLRLDGDFDDTTNSWVYTNSSTGEVQNPVSGGLTDVDAEHITINDWLQNISHQIGSFFSGAIGAVSTLVSAGSDFIHSLSGLYAWLPAPVYSVLVSALILVITIGVIKVFI